MAIRTTAEAVGAIIDVASNITLTPFMEVANALVTECCSEDDYDAARLELIERWLSAHFYAIRDMQPNQERAGDVSVWYQSKVDLGLSVTHYGQQAMMIDTAGGLAELNQQLIKGPKVNVSISHIGMNEDEAEDYNTTT